MLSAQQLRTKKMSTYLQTIGEVRKEGGRRYGRKKREGGSEGEREEKRKFKMGADLLG